MNRDNRLTITNVHVTAVVKDVVDKMLKEFEEHGRESHVSKHEGLGIIMEEVTEMQEAVRHKDDTEFTNEVRDVVIAGLWYLASEEVHKRDINVPEVHKQRGCTGPCFCHGGCVHMVPRSQSRMFKTLVDVLCSDYI
jgi:hypothetical protein